MNAKTYDRITTSCMAVGIASAFLFEHSGSLNAIVGSIGILAALVAVSAYFRNNYSPSGDSQTSHCEKEQDAAVAEECMTNAEPLPISIADPCFQELAEENLNRRFIREWREFRTLTITEHRVKEPDVVGKVVEIVQRLSASESLPAYEFILSPNCTFTIRPMGRRHTALEDLRPPVERVHEELPPEVPRMSIH